MAILYNKSYRRSLTGAFQDEKVVFGNTDKVNTAIKGVLLIAGVYAVTLLSAACIILSAIAILMETHSCSVMGRALLALWIMIAVLFLASAAAVGGAAWKIIPNRPGRVVVIVVHSGVLLVSYIVIAFGLMVVFNC